ncbi:MAG: hypothetical protein LC792_20855, partial [Actinobacteria bacterium]|nr:hypothetical protein [Actinomycetota bacterium]
MPRDPHGHAHGPEGSPGSLGRVPPPVARLLVLAVAPLLLATLVGLVVLWPRGRLPTPKSGIGLRATLVTGTVATVTKMRCKGGPATIGTCQSAQIRLTSGPDKGTVTILDLSVGPGNPTFKKGDRVLLGLSTDPTGR